MQVNQLFCSFLRNQLSDKFENGQKWVPTSLFTNSRIISFSLLWYFSFLSCASISLYYNTIYCKWDPRA